MTKILNIHSNPNPQSISTNVLKAFLDEANADIETLDLVTNPLEHLDADAMNASGKTSGHVPGELTATEQNWVDTWNKLIDQLLAADIITIAAPMWNFGIPSGLKAYVDHIVQPKKTFAYQEGGPVGLIKDKKIVLVGARGGDYSGMPQMEHHINYLKSIFGWLGITDQHVIIVEGAMMPDAEQRIEQAKTKAKEIASQIVN